MDFKGYKSYADLFLIFMLVHSFYMINQIGNPLFVDGLFKYYLPFLPVYFLKIFGITIVYWTNSYVVLLALFLIGYNFFKTNNIKMVNFSLYYKYLPTIISFCSSFFFIYGLGNIFNGLYKRGIVQLLLGVVFDVMYFYWSYSYWALPFNQFIGNTAIVYSGILLVSYSVYVTYDTGICTLCKYYDEHYPKFSGLNIDN